MIVWLLIGSIFVVFSILFVIASIKDEKRRKLEKPPQTIKEITNTLPKDFVPLAQRLKEKEEELKKTPKARGPFEAEIPFGIKYARVLNAINFYICVIASIIIAVGSLYIVGKPNTCPRIFFYVPWIIAGISVLSFIAFLLYKLNEGLIHVEGWAKNAQIIMSVLGLLSFPIGTILWGICLYFMCFDPKTNEAFQRGL